MKHEFEGQEFGTENLGVPTDGFVKVIHGANDGIFDVAGETVASVQASLADAFNIPVSNHCFTEMSMSLLASIPHAHWLEYMHWLEPVYRERIELNADGHAVMPTAPGWGFSFDPDAVKKYAV